MNLTEHWKKLQHFYYKKNIEETKHVSNIFLDEIKSLSEKCTQLPSSRPPPSPVKR